ncbi:MAG: TylF/MycF/NovP-related O-methyltransferase [Xanthobacteraceae bacterium]|nr:TylF/MycF/NovP-related O-methyltransferase [Xanthobacteraceae bacterium]
MSFRDPVEEQDRPWPQPTPRTPWRSDPPTYEADHLAVWQKRPGFLDDERFLRAYRRGADSGLAFDFFGDGNPDPQIEWRVHIACWAALQGSKLPGDFVECGVNTGFFSLAICDYVDFNATGKTFWLFDTFSGIPTEQISPREAERGRAAENAWYPDCFERATANFAPYPRARLVRGKVPDTLASVSIAKVAYLHLDMNIAYPERAAIEHFWPRLARGALVVLDDYGWQPYAEQKAALDDFASRNGTVIATLPTGQGLMIKA